MTSHSDIATAVRCPECGRWFLPRRYATEAERRAAQIARIKAAADARTTVDMEQIVPRLPRPFRFADVGRAMWVAGRHWSEAIGAVNRLEQRGLIRRVADGEMRPGGRTFRRWEVV